MILNVFPKWNSYAPIKFIYINASLLKIVFENVLYPHLLPASITCVVVKLQEKINGLWLQTLGARTSNCFNRNKAEGHLNLRCHPGKKIDRYRYASSIYDIKFKIYHALVNYIISTS